MGETLASVKYHIGKLNPNGIHLSKPMQKSPPHPHCKAPLKQGLRSKSRIRALFQDRRSFIRYLLFINFAMFALTLLLGTQLPKFTWNPMQLMAPEPTNLIRLGATGTVPIDRMLRWWSLLAANYLHGGILHLLFNMTALWQLSRLIVSEFGTHRMFLLYTLSGVGGYALSYLSGVEMTIGASAAICGLMGASVYYGIRRGGDYGRAIYRQVGGWALFLLLFGWIVPGINNWAHGGGFASGALLAYLLGYKEQRETSRWQVIAAWVCLLLTGGVLAWAISTGVYYRYLQ